MAISVSILSEIPTVPASPRGKTRSEGPSESFASALSTADTSPPDAPSEPLAAATDVNDSPTHESAPDRPGSEAHSNASADEGPPPDLSSPIDDGDRAIETAVSLVLQQVQAELPTPVSALAGDGPAPAAPRLFEITQTAETDPSAPIMSPIAILETPVDTTTLAGWPAAVTMPVEMEAGIAEAIDVSALETGIEAVPVPVVMPLDGAALVTGTATTDGDADMSTAVSSPVVGNAAAAATMPAVPTTPLNSLPEMATDPSLTASETAQPSPVLGISIPTTKVSGADATDAAVPNDSDGATPETTDAKAATMAMAATAASAVPQEAAVTSVEEGEGETPVAAVMAPTVSLRKPVLAVPGDVAAPKAKTADTEDETTSTDKAKTDKPAHTIFEKLMTDPATAKAEKDADTKGAVGDEAETLSPDPARASPPKPETTRADAPRIDPVRPEGGRNDAPRIDIAQPSGDASSTAKLQPLSAQPQSSPGSSAAVALPHLAVTIASRARGGERQFDIRLDPAELGRIDVKLSIDEKGTATTRISVERMDTLDLLQRDSRALERALTQAGFKTDEGGLQFSLRDRSDDAPRQQNGFADRDESGKRYQVVDDKLASDSSAAPPPAIGAALYGRGLMRLGGIDVRV